MDIVRWASEGEPPDAAAAAIVSSIASDHAPDVVHFHNLFDRGVVDALRERFPSVWTCHDHRSNCPNGDRVYPRSQNVCRLAMGGACVVKSVTQGCVAGPRLRTLRALRLREQLFASLAGCDAVAAPSRCVSEILLKNGVDGSRIALVPLFTPFADVSEPPEQPNTPRALFAARLVPQKGVDDIVWLSRRLRGNGFAGIAVAGDGPRRSQVEAAAKEGALSYLGFLDTCGMARAYEESTTVLVVPHWIDPFPMVAIEALAFARPVVCYRLGGVAEIVEDGRSGIVVEPNDRESLFAGAARLIEDPRLAEEFGRHGRDVVRARHRPRHGLVANEAMYDVAMRRRGTKARSQRYEIKRFRATERSDSWPVALDTRLAVFVREQDVPFEAEEDWHDTADPTCLHVLALTESGRAAAAGRLYNDDGATARIGRMVVLAAFRGCGIGMRILDVLLEEARRRGCRYAVLDSQTHALAFYARRGFKPEGAVFDDCGIPHQRMRVELM